VNVVIKDDMNPLTFGFAVTQLGPDDQRRFPIALFLLRQDAIEFRDAVCTENGAYEVVRIAPTDIEVTERSW
jgi:hypothetical protein